MLRSLRSALALAGLALACLAHACGGAVTQPRVGRPNVLLISIDTLRPDHLGTYGYGRDTSPRLDALAREGVVFENHISSSSWTLPAHAALFTGVSDSVHGCVEADGTALAPEFTTVAERFRASGYATGGFYAGPYLHEAFGLGQGFETYRYTSPHTGPLAADHAASWAMDPGVMSASHTGVTNPEVYGAARQWMQAKKDEPFFCFVHFWDVHFDFVPPPPYDTMFDPDYAGDVDGRGFFFDPDIVQNRISERDKDHLRALYDGEIRWTDDHVGKLLDDLDAWGLAENTIVVVTSDHGTEFWEHGGIAHRTTLYDELIRTPLVVRYPGEVPAGGRVEAQTRIIDVGPTVLALAGVDPLPGAMGQSLMPLVRGDEVPARPALSELYSIGRALSAVRGNDTKLIHDQVQGVQVWFDLALDPGERNGQRSFRSEAGGAARERYRVMLGELGAAVARRPAAPGVPDVPVHVRDALRAAGYVGEDEDR
ncbi:MAG: sulfatase [bacterium]|nr:sulfatase [bacterium]